MDEPQLKYSPIEKNESQELWEIIYQALHRHAQPGWNEHVGYQRFRAVKLRNKILGGMGIIDMGQVPSQIKMEINMLVNGKMTQCMVREHLQII